jgi:hypothetical protein
MMCVAGRALTLEDPCNVLELPGADKCQDIYIQTAVVNCDLIASDSCKEV